MPHESQPVPRAGTLATHRFHATARITDMKARLLTCLFVLLPAFASGSHAGELQLPAPYEPQQAVSGAIRIWGHGAYDKSQDFIETLVLAWEQGFRKLQPQVSFENHLNGTAAAIGALYTGAGDLALMGREIWPPESAAFQEVFGYPPTGVNVITGSFNVRNRGYAIVIFVHKDNPLTGLTHTPVGG